VNTHTEQGCAELVPASADIEGVSAPAASANPQVPGQVLVTPHAQHFPAGAMTIQIRVSLENFCLHEHPILPTKEFQWDVVSIVGSSIWSLACFDLCSGNSFKE